jgi:DNA relaxase NicK
MVRAVGGGSGGSTLTHGNRHYSSGVRADDWSWQVLWSGQGGSRGTVYVETRQTLTERTPEIALTLLGLGVRPSRIDLACDVGGDSWHPSDLFALRDEAWTRTRRGGWTLTLRGDGGATLYVGSRSSDRFLRVYVKGAIVRHELELKGAVAAAVGASLEKRTQLGHLWAAEYAKLVRWPVGHVREPVPSGPGIRA